MFSDWCTGQNNYAVSKVLDAQYSHYATRFDNYKVLATTVKYIRQQYILDFYAEESGTTY